MRKVVARTIGGDRVIPDTAASPTAFPADLHSWMLAQEGGYMTATLPGVGPVLPRNPLDRGKLLLSLTRELIDLRAKVRTLERQCEAIIASLHEGRS